MLSICGEGVDLRRGCFYCHSEWIKVEWCVFEMSDELQDDEIDLRELLAALWDGKLLIFYRDLRRFFNLLGIFAQSRAELYRVGHVAPYRRSKFGW